MLEHQSLWGLGSKAKQIKDNACNYFHREPEEDYTAAIQQTAQATGVGLTTVYKIRSKAKSAGGFKKNKQNKKKNDQTLE